MILRILDLDFCLHLASSLIVDQRRRCPKHKCCLKHLHPSLHICFLIVSGLWGFPWLFCILRNALCVLVQSCPTLCNPKDCSLPGSSVRGISQAGILQWVAISFSRESSRPRDWNQLSHPCKSPALQADSLQLSHQGKSLLLGTSTSRVVLLFWWTGFCLPGE